MGMVRLLGLTAACLTNACAGIVVFNASGTFQDGSSLSGTLSIDTIAGAVVSGDLKISGNPADFTTLDAQNPFGSPAPFLYLVYFENGEPTNNWLGLGFPPASLSGYSGGVLCGNIPACSHGVGNGYISSFATLSGGILSNFTDLDAGRLTATPEPATWLILLPGLALARRRPD